MNEYFDELLHCLLFSPFNVDEEVHDEKKMTQICIHTIVQKISTICCF